MSILIVGLVCLEGCHRSSSSGSRIERQTTARDEDPPSPIKDVAFSGADLAWVVTGSGDLLRSRDRGETWDRISGGSVGGFDRVCFVNGSQGWALRAGFRGSAAEYENGPQGLVVSTIFGTNDSGTTWNALAQLTKADVESAGGAHDITFVDNSHGWLTGPFGVWRSTDGGREWHWHPYPAADDPVDGAGYVCQFVSPELGWLDTSGGQVYRTEDGAQTWHPLRAGPPALLRRPANLTTFLDDGLTGLMIGSDARLFHTEDGGHSWRRDTAIGHDITPESVDVLNKEDAWIVASVEPEQSQGDGPVSLLVHTTDGGRNWERMAPPEPGLKLFWVHFADTKDGWLEALHATPDGEQVSKLFRTSDGGSNWTVVLNLTGLGDSRGMH